MVHAVLALGSNLGDTEANLNHAVAILARSGLRVSARSFLYESSPALPDDYSGPRHGVYLNAAVIVETALSAEATLAMCMETERSMGRTRRHALAPRVIDLDLIFFGGRSISTPELILPHPRWRERDFVLAALLDLALESPDALLSAEPTACESELRRLLCLAEPHIENRRPWL